MLRSVVNLRKCEYFLNTARSDVMLFDWFYLLKLETAHGAMVTVINLLCQKAWDRIICVQVL